MNTSWARIEQENPMHVVRHDHERVGMNVRKMIWQLCPTFMRDFAKRTQSHCPVPHPAKDVGQRTDGDEIDART
jgi:hypothetical protein